MSKYGIKIKNIQAGTLYGYNLGSRDRYEYTNAMFSNNLLSDFLQDNGMKVSKRNTTKDIICLEFDFGSRSYEEERQHIEKRLCEDLEDDRRRSLEIVLQNVDNNRDKYHKMSKEQIREIFYRDGVDIEYRYKEKNGEISVLDKIHYKMLYRSTGKAKDGSCMFINETLWEKAHNFITMGIDLPEENAPIVEISAYASLIASTIVDRIKINPKNILILSEVDSFFETNVISVETDKRKHCVTRHIDNYKLKNAMFDGQSLVDVRIFPKWGDGAILLRHHMCKMGGFCTDIQLFFKDYFGDDYLNAKVTDMFGNEHFAKDIEIITTDNAMKWLKFGITYDYWCDRVFENECMFGIVKTTHQSKLGDVQKMSYQMINSLDLDIMENVVKKSKDYIELMKKDDDVFLEYLKENQNFSNDYVVLVHLCEQNPLFVRSEYFRQRKYQIVRAYITKFRFGKVIQDADNLTIVGSPYAMLLHSVGEDVELDDTFSQESDSIQCYTERFTHGERLACFRSPFNSKNNMGHLLNTYSDKMQKYFQFGKQVIAVNMLHTDFQDRNNGSDQDFDGIYTTNQIDIVDYSKFCYLNFPTIVNLIPKEANSYANDILNYAKIDNNLALAKSAIGESSNLAQLALTYSYNFKDQKFLDYVCILSVLAQVCIDSAKRRFDLDINAEIKRIKKDMGIQENKYPEFWKYVKHGFDKDKINPNLKCPMNYLCDLNFKTSRMTESVLPMDYFFKQFQVDQNRRKSKKVEELIQKYSMNIYHSNKAVNEDYLLLRFDFDELVDDIKNIHLSKDYLGLMSWLINRAFVISAGVQRNKETMDSKTKMNKSILLKVLYDLNTSHFLKCFSNNIPN